MSFFFLGQLYGFCCLLDNITLLSKQKEWKKGKNACYNINIFSKAKQIKSLLKVRSISKAEINKNKPCRVLILVRKNYLSLGPLGMDGKIFLISKNRFLNVTTLTFPAIDILD